MDDTIRAAQAGDHEAFAALMRSHRRLLYFIATRYLDTQEDVDDAVQVAMWKAWRYLPAYRVGHFSAWLCTIARNTCKDMLRRRHARPLDVPLDAIAGMTARDGDPECAAMQQEAISELIDTIMSLVPVHSTVVLLVDIHGLEYDEAAGVLGAPLGTIKSRLSRGRAALRERIER